MRETLLDWLDTHSQRRLSVMLAAFLASRRKSVGDKSNKRGFSAGNRYRRSL